MAWCQATSHYPKHWWLIHWHTYASFGLNELLLVSYHFTRELLSKHTTVMYQFPVLQVKIFLLVSKHFQTRVSLAGSTTASQSETMLENPRYWITWNFTRIYLDNAGVHLVTISSHYQRCLSFCPLQWRHNERDDVSNHRRLDFFYFCRLFRRR